ncbi:uncharacterized protein Z520_07081 [Fonsecaea multimorphosa CBS 102226]|uniref:Uncharacterized protein n=1 Tax=Fonsecaea multimorphosa CBS 102226 TaxID=1442371 RepID=A0A0D2JU06_9EURO|nr:uncharacterized protein Z520_07081 [Fonsecaea multimorphosa CBS 102226]KIX96967.1 hypothetical protein Z520_07081 [Fonsecaea multimorphosa CBS 102226]OAL23044.1 hypothetical protein AYO22_06658 [Fonsecaea multimorphosa]
MRSSIAVAAGLAAVASAGTTTITDTVDVTITSCEPTVTNCPYKGGSDPTWGDWSSVTASTTSSVPVGPASKPTGGASWDPSGTWADWSSASSSSSTPVGPASKPTGGASWDPSGTWADWSSATTTTPVTPVSATTTAPCGSYTATTPPAWFSLLPTDQLSSIQAQWTGAPPSDWCYWTYSTGSLTTTATPVAATSTWPAGSPSGGWSSPVAAASTGTGAWSSPVAAASTGVWSYSGSATPVQPAVATFTGAANANTGSFALAGLAAAAVLVMA